MKVLIIEDDLTKSSQIATFIRESYLQVGLKEAHSFQSGRAQILRGDVRVILLDMTLPTYDIGDGETGGRVRTYGGIDILAELQRLELTAAAIVVTQFETFGEGPDKRSLKELISQLVEDYPGIYRGTVYYHPAQSDWKPNLSKLLEGVGLGPMQKDPQ